MKKFSKLVSILMVLCLFVGMVSAASISGTVQQGMEDDAADVGFASDYADGCHFVDAKVAGADVTAKLPHDLAVPGRTVAVAVQAVTSSGSPLSGHPTRFVLGTYSNGAVTVTYQENDCRYFAMMPIQGYLDQGSIHHLETTASKVNSTVYNIYVEARLIMSDDLAEYVVMNRDDDRLLDMRFTCYLENEAINASHETELQDLAFSDPHGIYELLEDETYATDGGVVIKYKLNEETFATWKYESVSSLKSILQTEVIMSCAARMSKSELRAAANSDNEVWTYGHLDLTYEPGGRMQPIPAVKLETILIPAEMDYVVIDDDIPVGPSGGGSSGKDPSRELADIPEWLNGKDHVAYVIGYEDGTVRPNNNITRAEVATIFFRLLNEDVRDRYMTQDNDYSDVQEGQWFNCAISTMSELGVIKGYPDGTFRPNAPITRAEFAAIAARFDGRSPASTANFSDIRGHWGAKEISRAYENGWVDGYPNGTFAPDQDITRAEAMTLVNRVLHRNPEEPEDLLKGLAKWTDNMNVNAWYYLAVQEATNSHEYKRKTNYYEYWTELEANPDWSLLEK